MPVLFLVLFIVAAVLFAVAAGGAASRFNLIALGLLAWVLVYLIRAVEALHG